MNSEKLPPGCYWGVKKPFEPNIYFLMNGFKLLGQEKLTPFTKINIKKLWQRKYMFIGELKALSIETQDFFFFFEQHPGQLYHCDRPNGNMANATHQQIICFFWDPDAKSCGLKIYSENKLIRHIESEIDYTICVNIGDPLARKDAGLPTAKSFNDQQLVEYLHQIPIDLPEMINPDKTLTGIIYTLTR